MTILKITLELDDADYAAVESAIESLGDLPDGEGNLDGRYLAEICRGWEEMRACHTPKLAKVAHSAIGIYRVTQFACKEKRVKVQMQKLIDAAADALGIPVPPME